MNVGELAELLADKDPEAEVLVDVGMPPEPGRPKQYVRGLCASRTHTGSRQVASILGIDDTLFPNTLLLEL
jgi:hypothetical protein